MVPGSIHAAISGVDAPLADPAAKLRLHQSQDCYGKKSFVRGLHESFSTPLRVACHQPEHPIGAVFCVRSGM
jgi:hypothetical protein